MKSKRKTPKRKAHPDAYVFGAVMDVRTLVQSLHDRVAEACERLRVIEGDVDRMQKNFAVVVKRVAPPHEHVHGDRCEHGNRYAQCVKCADQILTQRVAGDVQVIADRAAANVRASFKRANEAVRESAARHAAEEYAPHCNHFQDDVYQPRPRCILRPGHDGPHLYPPEPA